MLVVVYLLIVIISKVVKMEIFMDYYKDVIVRLMGELREVIAPKGVDKDGEIELV